MNGGEPYPLGVADEGEEGDVRIASVYVCADTLYESQKLSLTLITVLIRNRYVEGARVSEGGRAVAYHPALFTSVSFISPTLAAKKENHLGGGGGVACRSSAEKLRTRLLAGKCRAPRCSSPFTEEGFFRHVLFFLNHYVTICARHIFKIISEET